MRLQLPFAAPRPLVLNRWRSAVASYPKSSEQEKGKKQDKREARNEKGRKEDGAQERGEAQEKDSVAERARAAVLAAASTPNKEEDVADVADRFVKASSSTGVDNDASTTSPPSSAKKSGVPNHGDLEDETSAHFADLQVEDEQAGRWWELTPPLGHNMVRVAGCLSLAAGPRCKQSCLRGSDYEIVERRQIMGARYNLEHFIWSC